MYADITQAQAPSNAKITLSLVTTVVDAEHLEGKAGDRELEIEDRQSQRA
jgi:hypothetical protein